MYDNFLDFEETIIEIKKKLDDINTNDLHGNNNKVLEKKIEDLYIKIYSNLTPWQKVQVARHQERPHTSDYIKHLISEFVPAPPDAMTGILRLLFRFFNNASSNPVPVPSL